MSFKYAHRVGNRLGGLTCRSWRFRVRGVMVYGSPGGSNGRGSSNTCDITHAKGWYCHYHSELQMEKHNDGFLQRPRILSTTLPGIKGVWLVFWEFGRVGKSHTFIARQGGVHITMRHVHRALIWFSQIVFSASSQSPID